MDVGSRNDGNESDELLVGDGMRAQAASLVVAFVVWLLCAFGCASPRARAPAPSASGAGAASSAALTSASLPDEAPAEVVSDTIAARTHALKACYASAGAAPPGTVKVVFQIAPSGTVAWAREARDGTPFPRREVVECVVSEFRAMTFPAAHHETLVVYPIVFERT